jgi:hypothetical protein
MIRNTICTQCEALLYGQAAEGKRPCPNCGATTRRIGLAFHDTVGVLTSRLRVGRVGRIRHRHRFDYEIDERATAFNGQIPARRLQVYDRSVEPKTYDEVIWLVETGEVLYETPNRLLDLKRRP